MPTNIDAQHDDVIDALDPYWEESIRYRSHMFRVFVKHPIKFFRAARVLHRTRPLDILSGKTPEAQRAVAAAFPDTALSDEQRDVRSDLLANFSIHAIAERLVAKFPDFDFAKIKKLHDARRSDRLKLTTQQQIAVALTVITFVGKSIPKSIVEEWMPYTEFEEVVFYVTIVIIMSMGPTLIAEWIYLSGQMRRHEFFGKILAYLELSVSDATPRAFAAADKSSSVRSPQPSRQTPPF